MIGEVKTANSYRKNALEEIKQYIQSQDKINNIIIGRGFNKFIRLNKIQQFFCQIRVRDLYQSFNVLRYK